MLEWASIRGRAEARGKVRPPVDETAVVEPSGKSGIALALGGGAARGWAHIGILEGLAEMGIAPDIVCGTSMGALVGAAFCGGRLPVLKSRVTGLGLREIAALLDLHFAGGGLIEGRRKMIAARLLDENQVLFLKTASSLPIFSPSSGTILPSPAPPQRGEEVVVKEEAAEQSMKALTQSSEDQQRDS